MYDGSREDTVITDADMEVVNHVRVVKQFGGRIILQISERRGIF